MKRLPRILLDESGAEVPEYAILAALIVIATIVALGLVRGNVFAR
jgi:Flp pilus assembly pilin Flp